MKEIMDFLNERVLRQSRRFSDFFPLAGLQSFLLTLFGTLMSMAILKLIPAIRRLLATLVYSESMLTFLENYLDFFGIWIIILLVVVGFEANRPMLKAISYSQKGNNLKGLLVGILLGLGTNGFAVLMSWLAGDIKLSFYGFDPVVLLVFALAVFIQSGAEELADRFYLYQRLRRRYRSPLVAIFVNAVVFALMHVSNPGFTVIAGTQIFLIAIVFSLMVYYYNNLWGAMAFHAAWNYSQNIIFGLPNSGIVSEYSIFTLEAASARNGLFYNVGFGVEGSIGATVMLALLAAVIYLINRHKPEANDVWAQGEGQFAEESHKN